MKYFLFVLLGIHINAHALFEATRGINDLSVSYKTAIRNENETFEAAWSRLDKNYRRAFPSVNEWDKNAQEMAVYLSKLDASAVTEWTNEFQLEEAFKAIRDQRFLNDPAHPNKLRRITWLYPDDGCYARAALSSEIIKSLGFPTPKKIYIFGSLRIETPNIPGGKTGWTYHVALTVKVKGKIYVLDPAMNSSRPMELSEWTFRMVKKDKDARLAVCSENTYIPSQSCLNSKISDDDEALEDQADFLPKEWKNILKLGRDPTKELWDNPPWSALNLFSQY